LTRDGEQKGYGGNEFPEAVRKRESISAAKALLPNLPRTKEKRWGGLGKGKY